MKHLFTCCLLLSCILHGQDAETIFPFPHAGNYSDITLTDSGVGYIVGDCGLMLKTTNGGTDWLPFDFPFEGKLEAVATSLTSNGDFVVVTTAQSGYQSSDGGANWELVPDLEGVKISTPAPGVFATYSGGTTFYYLDQSTGNGWETLSFPQQPQSSAPEFGSANVGYYFGTDSTLYRSSDGGRTYVSTGYQHSGAVLSSGYSGNDDGWIYDQGREIYRTTDGGSTWNLIYEDYPATLYILRAHSTTHLTAFASNQVFHESFDGGLTWAVVQTSEDPAESVVNYHTLSDGQDWLVGKRASLFLSVGGFSNYEDQYDFRRLASRGLALASDGTIYAAASPFGLLVGNGSGDWSYRENFPVTNPSDVYTLQDNRVVVKGNATGLISSNEGNSFFNFMPPFEYGIVGNMVDLQQLPSGRIIFTGRLGTAFSDDNAQTWTATPHNLPFTPQIAYFTDDLNGHLLANGDNYARTIDGGLTWQTVVTDENLTRCHFIFTDVQNGFIFGPRRLRTTDGGESWTLFEGPNSLVEVLSVSPTEWYGYAVTFRGTNIHRSLDAGENWELIYSSCNQYRAADLSPDHSSIYFLSDGNIVDRLELSSLNSISNRQTAVRQLHAYPNPTDLMATIDLEASANELTYRLLDLNGRTVHWQTLIDTPERLNIDVQNLPTGIYLLEVKSADWTGVSRLVVK